MFVRSCQDYLQHYLQLVFWFRVQGLFWAKPPIVVKPVRVSSALMFSIAGHRQGLRNPLSAPSGAQVIVDLKGHCVRTGPTTIRL